MTVLRWRPVRRPPCARPTLGRWLVTVLAALATLVAPLAPQALATDRPAGQVPGFPPGHAAQLTLGPLDSADPAPDEPVSLDGEQSTPPLVLRAMVLPFTGTVHAPVPAVGAVSVAHGRPATTVHPCSPEERGPPRCRRAETALPTNPGHGV